MAIKSIPHPISRRPPATSKANEAEAGSAPPSSAAPPIAEVESPPPKAAVSDSAASEYATALLTRHRFQLHFTSVPARQFHPSPRQELAGRAALVVLGIFFEFVATKLGHFCLRMIYALNEAGSSESVRIAWPLLIVAGFFALVGLSLMTMAFVPSREKRRGPPRGFVTLTRAFDAFWETVRRISQRI